MGVGKSHGIVEVLVSIRHYRFALDWPSILPTGNLSMANRQALRYYRCVVSEGLKLNISSMVTLYYPTHAHLGLPVSHDSRVMTSSSSPCAWRHEFPGAAREAP